MFGDLDTTDNSKPLEMKGFKSRSTGAGLSCDPLLFVFSFPAAGNSVEVDESLFQEIEDLDLDEDDPDFDLLEMGSDED